MKTNRRRREAMRALAAVGALAATAGRAWPAAQPAADPGHPPLRELRYAFPVAETGFDPVQVSDLYSRTVCGAIFEAPLEFDFLARPVGMRPRTAAAMPEITDGFRRFVVRIRPGIFFADDPAFGGKPRELTAADYVYTLKRHYDPRWKSPNLYLLEGARILGLSEVRQQALDAKQPFPYDTEVEGLRTLDRYTFELRLAQPAPRFHQTVMTDHGAFGCVAREVVERYGDSIPEHPVGTGAFRLAEWRRSSRIVLDRNPGFRDERYAEVAPPDDPEAVAFAARLKGRRLPLVDRVAISIIEESQPRWLAFLNGESDLCERLPNEFADVAIPNNTLAPNLAKRGITMSRSPVVDVAIAAIFNTEHPLIGGNAPEKVALRRALALAYDVAEEIRSIRRKQAVPSQLPVSPMAFGYDPQARTEMSEYSPAKAKALLDLYGYVDRDGDGWREMPDGSPLAVELGTQPDQVSRQGAELWEKCLRAVGVRLTLRTAKWPENLKAMRAGKLMMWGVGWSSTTPDGDTFLALGDSRTKGTGANLARWELAAFDELYRQQARLPDSPERQALMREAGKLLIAYMPYKIACHRIGTDLMQPWVVGHRRNPFVRDWFRYIDSDPTIRQRVLKGDAAA